MVLYGHMATPNPGIGNGFTEGELQFASFWVRHEILIRRLLYGILFGVNALLWGAALWGLLDAYAISYPRESRITAEIAENQFLAQQLQSNRPEGVSTSPVNTFQGTDGRLDMLVKIRNPNARWWAEFTYRFNIAGELTPARSGFVLPGHERYLGEFGYKPDRAGSRSAVLTVDNIRWHRLQPEQVGGDFPEWLTRRNAFEIGDIAFQSDLQIAGKNVGRTSFSVRNATAFGYWSVGLYVILERGSTPVAANYITLERVSPGEVRNINIDWFEQLPGVTNTVVQPVVNYLDTSAYLPTTQFER